MAEEYLKVGRVHIAPVSGYRAPLRRFLALIASPPAIVQVHYISSGLGNLVMVSTDIDLLADRFRVIRFFRRASQIPHQLERFDVSLCERLHKFDERGAEIIRTAFQLGVINTLKVLLDYTREAPAILM